MSEFNGQTICTYAVASECPVKGELVAIVRFVPSANMSDGDVFTHAGGEKGYVRNSRGQFKSWHKLVISDNVIPKDRE